MTDTDPTPPHGTPRPVSYGGTLVPSTPPDPTSPAARDRTAFVASFAALAASLTAVIISIVALAD